MTLDIVILAAGQGKRMHSEIPKVLHRIANKPLLEHVILTAMQFSSQPPIVIFGHEGDKVRQALTHLEVQWVRQTEQLGTGHAVQQALPQLSGAPQTLILYGDVPLLSHETLKKLISQTPINGLGIVTALFPNPTGLGRILRDADNNILDIVEERDASAEQRAIPEINSGIYLIPSALLQQWLPALQKHNAQAEYYLTDVIKMAVAEKIQIHSVQPLTWKEVQGVNDRSQLSQLERHYQQDYAEKLMQSGVTLLDPARLDIRGELHAAHDVTIDVNVIIEGHVKIGKHTVIGPNTILRNVIIGENVEIKANSVIDGAEIADGCIIGPFARIRPGTMLASKTHIGNFVEIKNSIIDKNTKINHLSYIGDSEIGKHVNIGAGTITCNFDGVNKHRTTIGDNAFIGSDSQLVAPITIGEGATIGAGSTITRDAPAHQLTVCRTPQRSIENWQRTKKKED